MLFIKKYGITCLVLAVVLYILVGAMAPFAGYKKISKETAASVDVNQFFQNPAGGERASILETGESAWEAVSYTHLDVYKRQLKTRT